MKLMDVFKRKEIRMLQSDFVKMIYGYQPVFSTYAGGLYEMDITVSAIHTFAKHCSKASPKIIGSSFKTLEKQLKIYMNDTMSTSQFLYRTATIYKCENNVYILPVYDKNMILCGAYPISTIGSSIVNINGELVLKYKLSGIDYAIPYDEVAHLKSHHYKKELMGEGNLPLIPTMELIDTQNQGIINGVKQSAAIRFIARLAQTYQKKDIDIERDRLLKDNLSTENNGGVMIFDAKFAEMKQVESKPFIVDAEQSKHIQVNVFNYIGSNEKIIQNNFNESEWGSYYEGELEPFLIQLSQTMSKVMFTPREISFGNMIIWESERLQYADTKTKKELITDLFDRGFLTHNQGLTILNLPTREDGDKYYIRKEYAEVKALEDPITVIPIEGEKNDK